MRSSIRTVSQDRTGHRSGQTGREPRLDRSARPSRERFGGLGGVAWPGTQRATLRRRGTGWQPGQKNDDRFMKATRRIGRAQRSHGSPSRP